MNNNAFTILLSFFMLAVLACGYSQSQKRRPVTSATPRVAVMTSDADRGRLQMQAEAFGKAFVEGDVTKVADATYPDFVMLNGGRAQMLSFLEQSKRSLTAQGFSVQSIKVNKPKQIISVDKVMYAVLPKITRMKTPQGAIILEGTFIGVSENGKDWKFIDVAASAGGKELLQTLLPSAWDKLELPK